MQLKNPDLLKVKAYIDGQWCDAASGETYPVDNPATGATIAEVSHCNDIDTRRAIEAADRALPIWRAKTAKERGAILRRWFDLMLANKDDLAMIMTVEQGKPLAEAAGEIVYGASFVEWFAEEGKRLYGDTIPTHKADTRIVTVKEPVGVVAGITPWNFPNAMITRKAGPALAAGCTIVIKPAESTPLSALALAQLAEEAGIPAGVLSIVTGDKTNAAAIGGEMTGNPIVRKISFTGSTPVGKLLMAQAAQTVKKTSMELGGNAPFIVFDDADVDEAVAGALVCKYRNAGQTCVCANRILVQDGIYDAFMAKFRDAVANMLVGDGQGDGVTVGPLINQAAVDKVSQLVEGAKREGATVTSGGERPNMSGYFYNPTILENVTESMEISNSEIFGPVASIIRFEKEEEAVRMANDTPFGLASYFYSRDIGRVWRVSEGLEYGMVGINTGVLSTELAPFGGIKESGIGREGSHMGIDEYVEVKYLCMSGI